MQNYCLTKRFAIIFSITIIAFTASVQATAALTLVRDQTFYLIWNETKLKWSEALKFCAKRNMKLLSFENADKLVKLNIYLMKQDFIDRPHLNNDYIYWTSGNDLKSEGTFVWESTGDTFNYTNWLRGMPDNWRGDEHCVEMGFRMLGTWNDNRCWYRRHFICERWATSDEIERSKTEEA